MNIEQLNQYADNKSGVRPNFLYGNMLDQMRYIEALGYIRDLDVLDIACGTGWGSYLMAKGGANIVIGVDLSEDSLKCAKQYYNCKNTRYILGNSTKIPLDDNSVDVIVSFETYEHVEDVNGFINELFRVAKPNGLLILSTPNGYCFKKNIQNKPENPFHFQEYVKKDIEDAFKNNWILVDYKGQYPMKIESEDIKIYRRWIFDYWESQKQGSKFGIANRVIKFLKRKLGFVSIVNEPAYKDSCWPKEIREGYMPAYHFFMYRSSK